MGIFLAIACLGFLALSLFRGGVGAAASLLLTPLTEARAWYQTSTATLPSYLRTKGALIAEVQSLRRAVAEQETGALLAAQRRADETSPYDGFEQRSPDRIAAEVLLRPNRLPYDTLLIDAGSAEGVVRGAAVYAHGGAVLGTVERAYERSALVRLVTAPGVWASAYVFGPNIFTETEGMGGGTLRISVPQGVPLTAGDIVMLPAGGSGVYGRIVEVVSQESSPYQYGYVSSPVSLQSLRFVEVARTVVPEISYVEAAAVVATASSTILRVDVPDGVLVSTSTATTTDGVQAAE